MGNLAGALQLIADPTVLLVIVLAGLYGIFIGSIPGLTATMATALLVPFAFFLPPLPAIASIVVMSAMAIYAGDIPGALVRMPGTPASAAYVEDAYGLTRSGRGHVGLGIGLIASVIGGTFGSLVLITAAPLLAEVAVQFTSFEYFWFAVMGLSTAVIISRGSPLRGMIALLVGLLISTVGLDPTMGYPRFTMGHTALLGGISFIPAMIGLFGLSEVLRNVMGPKLKRAAGGIHGGREERREVYRIARSHKGHIARGTVIGTGVGLLPGAGGDIAAWVSYGVARNAAKDPDAFGKNSTEAIAASSASNNSGLASAWVPTLVLGIPGDTVTAILIGVLYMQGLRPGPSLFREEAALVTAIYLVFIIANVLLLGLGYVALRTSGLMLRAPKNVLLPIIVVFCILGSFAVDNNPFDVWLMLGMGVLGFLMERASLPIAPVVLAIVLGPIVEANFMRSVIRTNWDLTQFFTRPISALLLVVTVLLWLWPVINGFRHRRRTADDDIKSLH